MSMVGYADGRPRVAEAADAYDKDEMISLANGLSRLPSASRIGALPSPPPPARAAPAC